MMVKMGKIGKFRKILENLEKLTSGNQNPTFKSGENIILSGNLREKSGKNDQKILYQPCVRDKTVVSKSWKMVICMV